MQAAAAIRVSIACEGVDRPIGMFDSGFGGLTVARAVIDLLPAEDLVYIGDTGRYPYGPKPLDEVRGYAAELAAASSTDHGVKAIIVACNTATAAGLDDLRAELPVPDHRRDRARRHARSSRPRHRAGSA